MASGAEALTAALERVGVPVVFGVADAVNLPVAVELRRSGIRFVTMPSTSLAVQAADGYARRASRIGVVLSGREPGPAVLPELAQASAAESPVVLLNVLPELPDLPGPPRPRPAPAPTPEPVVPIVKLREGENLVSALRGIAETATRSPRRPVVVQVTERFLEVEAAPEPDEDAVEPASPQPRAGVEHVQLRRAGNLVDDSQSVLIWAGGGAMRAHAGGAIAELAEKVGAPVILTQQAAGLLPARHPCLVGLPPHLPAVGALWDKADLVIAVGTDFDEQSTQGLRLPEPANLIAINIDPVDAGRHYRPGVLLRGDAKTLTKALSDAVSYRGGTAVVRSRLQEIKEQVKRDLRSDDESEAVFLESLAGALPDRTTVVADPCTAGRWMAAFHEWTLPRTLLTPTSVDVVGFALPAAIGAAMTGENEPLLAVIGGDGMMASLGALSVMAREKPALTVLIVDEGGSGRLRPVLTELGQDAHLFDHPSPDFASTARTFGIRADTVTSVGEELTTAVRAHVAAPDPTVLVLKADLSQPPTDQSRWYRKTSAA
ncbi:thiamine pyrophosphate-binding protein [Euzebya tangerina]|uniref:thiamine pyrophosphate-binding protein n=1 Tax=Euzebya tangerina TaxID=591198 RepID=UPI000E318E93|nr:thiamine pyrophosphate-dependent enzyme [Euzebya tangerina]